MERDNSVGDLYIFIYSYLDRSVWFSTANITQLSCTLIDLDKHIILLDVYFTSEKYSRCSSRERLMNIFFMHAQPMYID